MVEMSRNELLRGLVGVDTAGQGGRVEGVRLTLEERLGDVGLRGSIVLELRAGESTEGDAEGVAGVTDNACVTGDVAAVVEILGADECVGVVVHRDLTGVVRVGGDRRSACEFTIIELSCASCGFTVSSTLDMLGATNVTCVTGDAVLGFFRRDVISIQTCKLSGSLQSCERTIGLVCNRAETSLACVVPNLIASCLISLGTEGRGGSVLVDSGVELIIDELR